MGAPAGVGPFWPQQPYNWTQIVASSLSIFSFYGTMPIHRNTTPRQRMTGSGLTLIPTLAASRNLKRNRSFGCETANIIAA
eukprot:scaffold494043_cov23-Prasinocladus_malaysianus.AAC.1